MYLPFFLHNSEILFQPVDLVAYKASTKLGEDFNVLKTRKMSLNNTTNNARIIFKNSKKYS